MSNFVLVKNGYMYKKMRAMNGLDHWTAKIIDRYECFILSLTHKDRSFYQKSSSLTAIYKLTFNICYEKCFKFEDNIE
ncbi:hypothetical protein RO3G_16210 [Rhizopus delemar RA 99-880]|uniref:Uncharacterized protein n=1 Tax=Rhizopus delemar (strain RA 99-880 / ATCC MYA-4621 / FGSC 9543 / NRRL 43880) TaxID=246409 RepID=I1CSR9_RHIO9|nr:hypothetical protein RO3G_16210 [Rhizopus delemar RA 99-880]|eukprot:EIE91499.1 hypothetical protein RO3G_16210 [Rhizopus delemar RA 99-880]